MRIPELILRLALGVLATSPLAACDRSQTTGPGSNVDAASDANAGGDVASDAGAEPTMDASDTRETPACPSTCSESEFEPELRNKPWGCSAPPICDLVQFEASSLSDLGPPYKLDTLEDARCVLEALRDGKEGRVRWSVYYLIAARDYDIVVRPGRLGLFFRVTSYDFISMQERSASRLRSPEFYEDCLSKTDPNAIYDCFSNAASGTCTD